MVGRCIIVAMNIITKFIEVNELYIGSSERRIQDI